MSSSELLVEALVETGWRLWSTAGNNTPDAQRVLHWMKAIAPGHLVMEITSSCRRVRSLDRLGTLVSSSDGYFTIKTIDDREFVWENAAFVRIPRNRADNLELEAHAIPKLPTCPGCRLPAHASDTDDDHYHAGCR